MRPAEDVARVRELASYGLNNSQIARLTGISRAAIRDWLRPDSKRLVAPSCASCGHDLHEFEQLPAGQYSYLLGVYLGDGTVSSFGRAFGPACLHGQPLPLDHGGGRRGDEGRDAP
jgi:hypothetical protein